MIGLPHGASYQDQQWRNIVPLHSTKVDVEKLLGPPPPRPRNSTRLYTPGPASSWYLFENEDVRVVYMTDELAERTHCSSFPVDTVIGIRIYLKKHPTLSDLGIDEKKFITRDSSEPPNLGFRAYIDNENGIAICTRDGKVTDIAYSGSARDRQVCPGFSGIDKSCTVLVGYSQSKSDPNRAGDE